MGSPALPPITPLLWVRAGVSSFYTALLACTAADLEERLKAIGRPPGALVCPMEVCRGMAPPNCS